MNVPYDVSGQLSSEDDAQLAAHGYVSSFKREFSNLATISFAFAIMVILRFWYMFPGRLFMIIFPRVCAQALPQRLTTLFFLVVPQV